MIYASGNNDLISTALRNMGQPEWNQWETPKQREKRYNNLIINYSTTYNKIKNETKKKKSISINIKRLVWNMNIGEHIGKSKCLCCKSTDITQLSFNCGHIIAEVNGGETIVSNLKPICQNCNSSMGTKNMADFMKSLK